MDDCRQMPRTPDPVAEEVTYLWNGEFGWELTVALPRVRSLCELGWKVTLVGYPDTAALYPPECTFRDNRMNGRRFYGQGDSSRLPELGAVVRESTGYVVGYKYPAGDKLPRRVPLVYTPITMGSPRETQEKRLSLHLRQFTHQKSGRDWKDNGGPFLAFLKDSGWELNFIGHPEFSIAPAEYGTDLRGAPMRVTVETLRRSRALIGPASGPVVLGLHCEVPVYTWSCCDARLFEEPKRDPRKWNPFRTAHFSPWSMNFNEDNRRKYHQTAYRPSPDELIAGFKYMEGTLTP